MYWCQIFGNGAVMKAFSQYPNRRNSCIAAAQFEVKKRSVRRDHGIAAQLGKVDEALWLDGTLLSCSLAPTCWEVRNRVWSLRTNEPLKVSLKETWNCDNSGPVWWRPLERSQLDLQASPLPAVQVGATTSHFTPRAVNCQYSTPVQRIAHGNRFVAHSVVP